MRDRLTKARIQARIDIMASGSLGDVKSVGSGVHEARIHFGAGYRLYFTQQGDALIILLVGGDKSTQAKDIQIAIDLAKTL